MATSYYQSEFRTSVGKGGSTVPQISTAIDSVRTFQFEVQFTNSPAGQKATLAAKKVTAAAITNEPIVVDRINDKVYYPGKTTPEEITVTFDNLLSPAMSPKLFEWFKGTYDPETGKLAGAADAKNTTMSIVMLDGDMNPVSEAMFVGVFPTKFSLSEFQYSENQFHTVEVTFRFDYMDVGTA
jgi:hypothetical protein